MTDEGKNTRQRSSKQETGFRRIPISKLGEKSGTGPTSSGAGGKGGLFGLVLRSTAYEYQFV